MAHRAVTRIVAAGATTAFAVGTLALLSTGIANADSRKIEWWDGNTHFFRTISNETPAVGETITITTRFERSSEEKIDWVKDHHPNCLTYVNDSATMNGTPVEPYLDIKPDYVIGDFNAGPFIANPVKISGDNGAHPAVLTVKYKVGSGCTRDVALQTGMSYSGSRGSGTYTTQGPSLTVTRAASTSTTTTLAPVTGAKVGTATTLTATVTGAATGDTVEFKDDDTVLGTGRVGANGKATYKWTPTTDGERTLTAEFPGTGTADASQSAPQTVQVAAAATDVESTTTLDLITGATVGKPITLKAKVTPAAAGGTIVFGDDGSNSSFDPVPVGPDGTATVPWIPETTGTVTVTATFSGRNGVTGSSTTQQVTVAPAGSNSTASTTTLDPITGAKAGTAITLKAKVTPAAAGGTIEFKDGTTVLGTAQVAADGTATYKWTPTTDGQRTITATFSGRNGVTGSTTTQQVTVTPAGGTNPGPAGSLDSLLGGFGS